MKIILVTIILLLAGCLENGPECPDCESNTASTNLGAPGTRPSLPDAPSVEERSMRLTMTDCPNYGGILQADREKIQALLPEGFEAEPGIFGYQFMIVVFDCPLNLDDEERVQGGRLGFIYTPVIPPDDSGINGTPFFILEMFSANATLRDKLSWMSLPMKEAETSISPLPGRLEIQIEGPSVDYIIRSAQDQTVEAGDSPQEILYVWHRDGQTGFAGGIEGGEVSLIIGPMSTEARSGMMKKLAGPGGTLGGLGQARTTNMDLLLQIGG